jgi:hypothetical protein
MKPLFSFYTGLLCFVLFSVSLQAQSGGDGKWSAGLVFSPDYAFRRLAFPESAQIWKEFSDENDLTKFGYTTGISILYRLHPALELESGLLYANKGYRLRFPDSEPFDENDPAIPLEYNTTYNFRYLDVPFKLNWFFYRKRAKLFLSAGVAASLFIDEFSINKAVYPGRTEISRVYLEDTDFNSVVFSLSGGGGIDYSVTRSIVIRINPEIRYGIIFAKEYNHRK